MTYLHDKQRQRNRIIGSAVFVVVLFLCFTYRSSLFKGFSPIGGFISKTFSFLQTPYDLMRTALFAGISSKVTLVANNKKLTQQVSENAALRERIAMLESNVAHLEKMSSSTSALDKGIVARRIHAPGATLYNTLIIDEGTNAGVQQGDLLVGEGGTLLGIVQEVFGNTARGLLFSAPNVTTEARLASSSIPMTLQGFGSGTFVARIPQGVEVDLGSVVVAQEYPKLHIGVVENIDRKPQDPFQTVYVKASESPYTIFFVKVVKHTL